MPTDPDTQPDAVRDQVQPQMNPEDAADVAVHAVDEIADLGATVEKLRAENADLQEQLLRRAAEFQNYRRRTDAERGQAETRGRETVLAPLLDVFDDLRRSLDAARRAAKQDGANAGPGTAFASLSEGVALVYRKFEDTLAQMGVEPIEAIGQPFDEELHEAMMQQPAPEPETASGTVLAEIQPGYRLGERVLRHAKVIVAA